MVAKGRMVDTLYLRTSASNYYLNIVSIREDATLWHQRLGHMSEKGIKVLHSRNFFLKLKYINLGFCENFIFVKHKRVRFYKVGPEMKKEKL